MDVAFGIQKIIVIKFHILKKIACQSQVSLHDIKDIMYSETSHSEHP